MVPAGRKSPVKLKKLFSDLKIASGDQKHYPVILMSNGEILWTAGVRRAALPLPAPGEETVRLTFIFDPERN